MMISNGFDIANKKRKDKPVRHIILWAKGWYDGTTLEHVIAKITAIQPEHVTIDNKFYWLKKACKEYGVEGYEIVDRFIEKTNGFINYKSPESQMIDAMRAELMEVKVKECIDRESCFWIIIHDLGKPDLFKEE